MAVGRIGKPHGIKGWVTVAPSTDEPELRFAVGAVVLLDDRPRIIEESRIGHPMAIRLDGVTDRAAAEQLRGQWLYADVTDDVPEDADEFYDHQLVGLAVRVGGDEVGTVEDVLHLPGQDVLVVRYAERQVLVPFVSAVVPEVDLEAGHVDVVPPEGLFDAD